MFTLSYLAPLRSCCALLRYRYRHLSSPSPSTHVCLQFHSVLSLGIKILYPLQNPCVLNTIREIAGWPPTRADICNANVMHRMFEFICLGLLPLVPRRLGPTERDHSALVKYKTIRFATVRIWLRSNVFLISSTPNEGGHALPEIGVAGCCVRLVSP